jgi:NADH-quinone oxidoreductase subunit J
MELVVFVLASAMVIGGAIGVVLRSHPVHAALSLVLTLFGVAVHFVAQEAHFLAAVQVIVYAAAIVVLFLFVIMLLGVDTADNLRIDPLRIQRPLAAVVGVAIVALMITAIVSTRELSAFPSTEPGPANTPTAAGQPDANIKDLAENLFSTHVFSFEFTSILLVVAVAGTVVLTRRQRRTHEDPSS